MRNEVRNEVGDIKCHSFFRGTNYVTSLSMFVLFCCEHIPKTLSYLPLVGGGSVFSPAFSSSNFPHTPTVWYAGVPQPSGGGKGGKRKGEKCHRKKMSNK